MSETNGYTPMIGGDHYYRATEQENASGKKGRGSGSNGIPAGLKIAAIAAAGVIAVGAIGYAAVMNSKPLQVARAATKTIKDGGYLVDDLGNAAFSSDKFTITTAGTVNADGVTVSGDISVAFDGKDKQIYGNATVPMFGNYEAVAELNSKSIQVQVPALDPHVFVYNYTKDNAGGALESVIGAEGVKAINDAIGQLYEIKPFDDKAVKDITKIVVKGVRKFDYDRIDPVKVTVDGKSRKCSGIGITIDSDTICEIVEEIFDYIEEEYGDEINQYNQYASIYAQYDKEEFMNEIRSELSDMPSIITNVYMYAGKIAAVEIAVDGMENTVQALFHGGDFRLQNVEIVGVTSLGRVSFFEIKGNRSGSEDAYSIYVQDEPVADFTYNHKSGDFILSAASYTVDRFGYVDSASYAISGNLDCSSKGIVLSTSLPSEIGVSGNVTVSFLKGAKFQKISGDLFDVGTASVTDFASLVDLTSILSMFF